MQATPRSYLIALGVPSLVFAVSFAMTGLQFFWPGIIGCALALCWFSYLWWRQSKGFGRILGMALSAAGLVWLVWLAFRPTNLHIQITSAGETFPEGSDIVGIPWKAEYRELTIRFLNEGEADYTNLDIRVYANLLFSQFATKSTFVECQGAPVVPSLMFGMRVTQTAPDTGQQRVTEIGSGDSRYALSTTYRLRCDHLLAGNILELTFALSPKKLRSMTPPHPPLEADLRWYAMNVEYEANGRTHNEWRAQCLISDCGNDLPIQRNWLTLYLNEMATAYTMPISW
jgi:hypothetical protein